jgi:polysaccharide export outer membrane protein
MLIKRLIAVFLALVVVGCGGGQRGATKLTEQELAELRSNELVSDLVDVYMIGVDDKLQITVWRNPDLSTDVPVRPDGRVSVPLIGDVQASGMTPEEVAEIIRQKLGKYIRDPQVTVVLTEVVSHQYLSRVRVTGAVRNQISIAYRQGMTVLDAILDSGGVNEFADAGFTTLYREMNGEVKSIPVYLDQILTNGALDTNYMLRPGDVLTVPERSF